MMTSPVPIGMPAKPSWSWRDRALCKSLAEQEVGSPMDPRRENEDAVDAAIRHSDAERLWCRRCPVKMDCLVFGVQTNGWGMYGGQVLRMGSRDVSCRICGMTLTRNQRFYCSPRCQKKAARIKEKTGAIPPALTA